MVRPYEIRYCLNPVFSELAPNAEDKGRFTEFTKRLLGHVGHSLHETVLSRIGDKTTTADEVNSLLAECMREIIRDVAEGVRDYS
jgi:hypothetical protein